MDGPTPYTPPDGHVICRAVDVRDGWEFRSRANGEWIDHARSGGSYYDDQIVEARPGRLHDPTFSWSWFDGERRLNGITTIGEMRGRSDLDRWEYADTDPQSVGWTTFSDLNWSTVVSSLLNRDSLPVIVRRKGRWLMDGPHYHHVDGDVWFVDPEHGVNTLIATGVRGPKEHADAEERHRAEWEHGGMDE